MYNNGSDDSQLPFNLFLANSKVLQLLGTSNIFFIMNSASFMLVRSWGSKLIKSFLLSAVLTSSVTWGASLVCINSADCHICILSSIVKVNYNILYLIVVFSYLKKHAKYLKALIFIRKNGSSFIWGLQSCKIGRISTQRNYYSTSSIRTSEKSIGDLRTWQVFLIFQVKNYHTASFNLWLFHMIWLCIIWNRIIEYFCKVVNMFTSPSDE